jgi:hypothetical protein
VDSGNLAGVLIALAQGLKGLAEGREGGPHWPGLSTHADRLSVALEAGRRASWSCRTAAAKGCATW